MTVMAPRAVADSWRDDREAGHALFFVRRRSVWAVDSSWRATGFLADRFCTLELCLLGGLDVVLRAAVLRTGARSLKTRARRFSIITLRNVFELGAL